MKLIDLLVQELPKRGGWPCGEVAYQDSDREVRLMGEGVTHGDFIAESLCSPDGNCQGGGIRHAGPVTRKQYESALAASQQQAWNDEGLPPVGCECEVKSGKESWTLCKVVHSSSAGVAFIYLEEPSPELSSKYMGVIDSIPHRHAGDYFRPIRTEAERKREEAIKFMSSVFRDHVDNKKSNGQDSVFHAIYDAFKAGKFE